MADSNVGKLVAYILIDKCESQFSSEFAGDSSNLYVISKNPHTVTIKGSLLTFDCTGHTYELQNPDLLSIFDTRFDRSLNDLETLNGAFGMHQPEMHQIRELKFCRGNV